MDKKTRRMLAASGILDIVTAAAVAVVVILFIVALILLWLPPVEEEAVPLLVFSTVLIGIGCVIYGAVACVGFVFGINGLKLAKRGAATPDLLWRIRRYLLCPVLYILLFGLSGVSVALEPPSALGIALAVIFILLFLGCTAASIVLKCAAICRVRKLLAAPPEAPPPPADPFADAGTHSDPSGGTPPADPFA